MVRSESRVAIGSGIEGVYDYLADVARWPEWAPAIVECHVRGDTPLRGGVTLEQRVKKMFGRTGPRTLDVRGTSRPRSIEFGGVMGPSTMRWGFDLTRADENHTDLALWIETEPRGVMRAMPSGVLRRMFRSVNDREVVAIKRAVEAAPEHKRASVKT